MNDPTSLSERIGDRPEVERCAQVVLGPNRQVLVVEKDSYARFGIIYGHATAFQTTGIRGQILR